MKKIFLAIIFMLTLPAVVFATYAVYYDNATDTHGNSLSGATVHVYLPGTSSLVTLYTTTAGGTSSTSVSSDTSGRFHFYVTPGTYDIAVTYRSVTDTKYNVLIGTLPDSPTFTGTVSAPTISAGDINSSGTISGSGAGITNVPANAISNGATMCYVNAASGAKGDNATDDKSAIDAVISACPPGGTVLFSDSTKTYFISYLNTINKSLTLDFNNVAIRTDPTTSGANGHPFINFQGVSSATYSIVTATTYGASITLADIANAATFTVGDFVEISDQTIVYAWDDLDHNGASDAGSSSASQGYSGRYEVNKISAINGAVLTLSKPIEWLYDGSVSGVISKVTMIERPEVKNIRSLQEVDPGTSFTGDVSADTAPHLIRFKYAFQPKVEGITIDGLQLIGVLFQKSIEPYVTRVTAKNAFRPTVGGHGYLMRFERCLGGLAEKNVGQQLRHVIDVTQSYDARSKNNAALDMSNSPYITHGLGAKRYVSEDDIVYTGLNASTNVNPGWCVGDTAFNADYSTKIIRPHYMGTGNAITIETNSADTIIESPDITVVDIFNTGVRPIAITTGAVNTHISGGSIVSSGSTGTNSGSASVFVRGKVAASDTFNNGVSNVYIDNVKIVTQSYSAAIDIEDLTGDLRIDKVIISGGTSTNPGSAAIYTAASVSTLSNLWILNSEITGTHKYGIQISNPPTQVYTVLGNILSGTFGTSSVLAASSILVTDNLSGAYTLNGDAGTGRDLMWTTNSTPRWIFRTSGDAESGSDEGSNFSLISRHDNGSAYDTIFNVVRSTGITTFPKNINNPKFSGTVYSYGSMTTRTQLTTVDSGNSALFGIDPIPGDATSQGVIRLFRSTNSTGGGQVQVFKGNNTSTQNATLSGTGNSGVALDNGNFGVGTTTFGANASGVFSQATRTVPTTSPVGIYQMYSEVQSGATGSVSMKVRTEDGSIWTFGSHLNLKTATTTTLSTCGTGPTLATGSNDFEGIITVGTGSPTACTVTFGKAFTNTPPCHITMIGTSVGVPRFTAMSNTGFTVTATAAFATGFAYLCTGINE